MRFGKFNLVGLIGGALQLLLSVVLTRLGLHAVQAAPIAVELTVLHNFVWHERFTWKDECDSNNRLARLWRFQLANGLVSIGGNTLLVFAFNRALKVPLIPSLVGAIGICSLVNFFIADRWVFAPDHRNL